MLVRIPYEYNTFSLYVYKPFACRQDTALRRGVAQYGVGQWAEIASALLPGRTRTQCKIRWEGALDPAVKKGAWTEAEVSASSIDV